MKKIGILTENINLSKFASEFRKREIDAKILTLDSDYKSFDMVIVDLAFPLEQAYILLEVLRTDYKFSETSIIVVISHRSQLNKLRTFAFGVDAYITPAIAFKDLLLKVKEIDDPEKHLARVFFEKDPLEISIEAKLSHISESGGILNSRVSLADSVRLRIISPIFYELGIDDKVVCKISKSNPTTRNKFLTEIEFSNLTDLDRDNIRKMILSWNAS